MNSYSRNDIATAIALLFHLIGLIGILFIDQALFAKLTPLNLLLMVALLVYTQPRPHKHFLVLLILCFFMGIFVEMIGTKTGLLFGDYAYGQELGFKLEGVPLIIGVNWFIVIYCCGISIHTLLDNIIRRLSEETGRDPMPVKALSVIVDGAILAVFFDWLLEPVAMKLGYWQWAHDRIPFFNYACWFGVSMIFLVVFYYAPFSRQNKFAVNLLLIQAMFFLLLRTFL
ncbi:MAG: carotenoid biosynthesis protein [Ferruginibacter sp.]|nr:carotenoid biosynthesis protein [Ferruginibacter sp.]